MTYATGTSVTEDRSRQEIERLLTRHGASRFGVITDIEGRKAVIGFTYKNLNVQMQIPLPDPQAREFWYAKNRWQKRPEAKAMELYGGEIRRRWRCLSLALKAKFVAVSDGITTIEREFMPYVVCGDGMTIGDKMLPHLEHVKEHGGVLPAMLVNELPALPPGRSDEAA